MVDVSNTWASQGQKKGDRKMNTDIHSVIQALNQLVERLFQPAL